VRESRTLRSRWRELETWSGSRTEAHGQRRGRAIGPYRARQPSTLPGFHWSERTGSGGRMKSNSVAGCYRIKWSAETGIGLSGRSTGLRSGNTTPAALTTYSVQLPFRFVKPG